MKSLDNNSNKEISNDNKDSTNKRKRDKGTSMEEPPNKIIIKDITILMIFSKKY